jgi:catechol 2,3-dioxygenase-like lactoylglutathione lyase family enzyme
VKLRAVHHVQVAMPKGGEAQARAFYGDVLGLAELPKPDELQGRGGCWFRLGATEIHLGADERYAEPSPKAHVAFVVDDLEATRAHLASRGVRIDEAVAIPGFRRFHAWDPFGFRLEFMEPSGPASAPRA